MKYLSFIVVLLILIYGSTAQAQIQISVLFSDDFKTPLDTSLWHVEMDSLAGSSVECHDWVLDLNTRGGVTVWCKKKLSGNYRIEYSCRVILAGGPNDRLSDLNQFWMASDPRNPNLFTRKGKFAEYDSLLLYYVGMGGNYNSTTRFRKYMGNGERQLLAEANDVAHLLEGNRTYYIKIEVIDGVSSFWVDDQLFFQYNDPDPIACGYFGFRSTWSHHLIDQVVISSLN